MNAFRAIALLWMILAGVIIWIISANVDRVFNGGEILALVLIVYPICSFVRAVVTE